MFRWIIKYLLEFFNYSCEQSIVNSPDYSDGTTINWSKELQM